MSRFYLLPIFFVSLFGLYLSSSHTQKAFLALPARPVVESVKQGERISTNLLVETRERLVRASRGQRDGEMLDDLSLIETILSERGSLPVEQRKVYLESAKEHLISSLEYKPRNTFVWVRLALVQQRLGAEDRMVAQALLNSIRYGCANRKIAGLRLSLALRVRNAFLPEELALLSEQVALVQRVDRPAYHRLRRLGLDDFVREPLTSICGEPM